MPAISMFYGVVIYIYFFDNKKHNKPHIHVKYAGSEVVLGLPDGEIMEGSIPNNKMKLVEAHGLKFIKKISLQIGSLLLMAKKFLK